MMLCFNPAHSISPSPGGGGSTRVKRAAGWGESLSSRAVSGAETVTPPRRTSRFARCSPTPPLQGRGKKGLPMPSAHVALRSAIHDALIADTALAAALGGSHIYD